jgi:hypothetical protein
MNRTFLVLALAVLSCAGCRTMHRRGGAPCGSPCCEPCGQPCCEQPCGQPCCEPCHKITSRHAPRPMGCCEGCSEGCGRGGCIEGNCPGGNGCVFDRYCGCGQECDPHVPPASAYDCSPCNSPNWGCNGHGHPFGYKTGHECYCGNGQYGPPCASPGLCDGYCGGCPAPACCRSGDDAYNFNPGPPVAQTAYPYYTLRGPRDFLMNNPPSIGPY